MSDLKVYGHIVSQPVRSVLAYLKLSNIPYTFEVVNFVTGEHLTPEFTKVNPFQSMPAITHGDYNLWESAAIITYISEAYDLDNSWYPKDFKVRGRINAYFHWHHQGTREPCMSYLSPKVLGPKLRGAPELTEEQEAPLRARFNQFLADVKWMLSETRYVARTSHATIADIFLYNELTLVTGLLNWEQHPEIKTWFDEIGAIAQVKELADESSEITSKILA